MASINIDYSSLPFSDLETNDRHQNGASDFEMQQMSASRCVRTSRATVEPMLTLAELRASFLHHLALVRRVTTSKTPL